MSVATARLGMRSPGRPDSRIGAVSTLRRSPTVLLPVDFVNPLDFPGSRPAPRA